MKKVLVIGSVNIDHYHYLNHFPNRGETIIADNSKIEFGGKGANQAVACAKFGAPTSFLGMIGSDIYTQAITENFNSFKIDTSLLQVSVKEQTGSANILLSENDNIIIVTPGANQLVNSELIANFESKICEFDYVLIQNEVDHSCLQAIVEMKLKNNFKLIYNPAPFTDIDDTLLANIDYITPNEEEYKQLVKNHQVKEEQLIITMGSIGVKYKGTIYPSLKVDVVDTTGAGDCFNGVFTAMLAHDYPVEQAIAVGAKAASLSITKNGAQNGYLTIDEYQLLNDI